MQKILCNEYLRAAVDTLGAQLVSIKLSCGTEVLWPGKEGVWTSHAPLLFPWAGRVKDAQFTHGGQTFAAGKHGFVSKMEHRCTKECADELCFEIVSSEATRKLFPYEFRLVQSFKLDGRTLVHTAEVTNTGAAAMFFGLGFHPGFICPFRAEKSACDYETVFDTPQSPDLIEITKTTGLPTGKKTPFMHNKSSIVLADDLFRGNTLCLSGLTASSITLREKPGAAANNGAPFRKAGLYSIEVGIKDVPYVLLWSAATEKLEFLCIEPWYSLPDFEDAQSEWETKRNLMCLQSGKTFSARLPLTFHTK